MKAMIMKRTIFIITLFLMLYGCRNSYELSMERGEYYYNVGAYESATLEYKSVINHYPHDIGILDEKTIHMLANAHHNLAVIYLKRSTQTEDPIKKSSFLEEANSEAKRAYNLYPKDAYKETWDSITAIM
jgi:tetratricopeptide (TPR) repeat protein